LKTIQLEKIKLRIVNQVENSDAEEKCLGEYRRELELLMQEKMSHVEELRQIHADINAVSAANKTICKQLITLQLSRWKPS
jgi:zinc finger C4H2 domain-contaning protein